MINGLANPPEDALRPQKTISRIVQPLARLPSRLARPRPARHKIGMAARRPKRETATPAAAPTSFPAWKTDAVKALEKLHERAVVADFNGRVRA